MEYVSGIKLRDIFLDNGNWWKLFVKHWRLIRISIIINVLKMLICRTALLGCHVYTCPNCKRSKKVPHSCKSRFCSSCGKKATDNWINTSFNTLPRAIWQHITFTMPQELWELFWYNRYLMNEVPALAAGIIKELAHQQGFIPGIFLAIHTAGRDLKRNFHIHLSTTIGGLSPSYDRWINRGYFYHKKIKNQWRYQIITLFRRKFQQQALTLPPHLQHLKSYYAFCSWTGKLYDKTWVVHLNEQSNNMKANIEYLGKYLKRPPLGETRIKKYDGTSVTYEYLDHYTGTTELMTLPVLDFIARLIYHIPDKNFRNIRYYGFLANRVRGKLLPLVHKFLNNNRFLNTKVYIPWRTMIQRSFHYDPLQCPGCGSTMQLQSLSFPSAYSLISMHKQIALGHFPRL